MTTKDRMITDLNVLVLHLIQASHTFEPHYRPMQIRLRVSQPQAPFAFPSLFSQEIAEHFKSQAVARLVRHIDELEKRLAKAQSVTLFGLSQRMHVARVFFVR